jgi:hypothetical protein
MADGVSANTHYYSVTYNTNEMNPLLYPLLGRWSVAAQGAPCVST